MKLWVVLLLFCLCQLSHGVTQSFTRRTNLKNGSCYFLPNGELIVIGSSDTYHTAYYPMDSTHQNGDFMANNSPVKGRFEDANFAVYTVDKNTNQMNYPNTLSFDLPGDQIVSDQLIHNGTVYMAGSFQGSLFGKSSQGGTDAYVASFDVATTTFNNNHFFIGGHFNGDVMKTIDMVTLDDGVAPKNYFVVTGLLRAKQAYTPPYQNEHGHHVVMSGHNMANTLTPWASHPTVYPEPSEPSPNESKRGFTLYDKRAIIQPTYTFNPKKWNYLVGFIGLLDENLEYLDLFEFAQNRFNKNTQIYDAEKVEGWYGEDALAVLYCFGGNSQCAVTLFGLGFKGVSSTSFGSELDTYYITTTNLVKSSKIRSGNLSANTVNRRQFTVTLNLQDYSDLAFDGINIPIRAQHDKKGQTSLVFGFDMDGQRVPFYFEVDGEGGKECYAKMHESSTHIGCTTGPANYVDLLLNGSVVESGSTNYWVGPPTLLGRAFMARVEFNTAAWSSNFFHRDWIIQNGSSRRGRRFLDICFDPQGSGYVGIAPFEAITYNTYHYVEDWSIGDEPVPNYPNWSSILVRYKQYQIGEPHSVVLAEVHRDDTNKIVSILVSNGMSSLVSDSMKAYCQSDLNDLYEAVYDYKKGEWDRSVPVPISFTLDAKALLRAQIFYCTVFNTVNGAEGKPYKFEIDFSQPKSPIVTEKSNILENDVVLVLAPPDTGLQDLTQEAYRVDVYFNVAYVENRVEQKYDKYDYLGEYALGNEVKFTIEGLADRLKGRNAIVTVAMKLVSDREKDLKDLPPFLLASLQSFQDLPAIILKSGELYMDYSPEAMKKIVHEPDNSPIWKILGFDSEKQYEEYLAMNNGNFS